MYYCDNSNSLLASYAIFSELYNSGKDNIFIIISEFIKEVIVDKAIYTFTLEKMVDLLVSEYSFTGIPKSVVKTALKKIHGIEKYNKEYIVNDVKLFKGEIDSGKRYDILEKNNAIMEKLYQYAQKHNSEHITAEEKEKLSNDFCQFILDDSTTVENSPLISAFILKNKNDEEFQNRLDVIKEGVLIYQGLNYDNTPNAVTSWKKKVTYFLETDILFHLMGLNGKVFQDMATEFIDLVQEINASESKGTIELRYFKETEEEIDNFFYAAEKIVRSEEKRNPAKTAMNAIIEGCKNPSDVAAKKTDFYRGLKENKIFIDDYPYYYKKDNFVFNLEGKEEYSQGTDGAYDSSRNEVYKKILSHVNVRRKGNRQDKIQDVDFLLISENQTIQKIARGILITDLNYSIPLAVGLSSITNKLWVQLSKGFGFANLPRTFQAITKAQIVLSKCLNDSVAKRYDELTKSELPDDKIIARLLDLRQRIRKPEDIIEDDSEEILRYITHDDINEFVREAEREKKEVEEIKKENVDLHHKLSTVEKNLEHRNEEKLLDLERTYKILLNTDKRCKKEIRNKIRFVKSMLILFVLLGFLCSLIATLVFSWSKVEPYAFYMSLGSPLITYIFLIVKGKKISPKELYDNLKNRIKIRTHEKYMFAEEELNEIKDKIETMKHNTQTKDAIA